MTVTHKQRWREPILDLHGLLVEGRDNTLDTEITDMGMVSKVLKACADSDSENFDLTNDSAPNFPINKGRVRNVIYQSRGDFKRTVLFSWQEYVELERSETIRESRSCSYDPITE